MDEKSLATLEAMMRVADTTGATEGIVKAFEAFMQAFLTLKADNDEQMRTLALKVKNAIDLIHKLTPSDGKTPIAGIDFPSRSQVATMIAEMIPAVSNGKTPILGEDYIVPSADDIAASMAEKYVNAAEIFKVIFALPDNVITAINSGESQISIDRIQGLQELFNEVRVKNWKPFYVGTGQMIESPSPITVGGAGGFAIEIPQGLVNNSNQVYAVTAEPDFVVADGTTYYEGAGYTYAAFQVTLDVKPSSWIRAIVPTTSDTSVETPPEVVDGSNDVFSVSAPPKWINSDGRILYEGAGYTYSDFQVTLDVAPSEFIRAVISNSSSTVVTTPVGVINGENSTYAVTAPLRWVIADGTTYYEGAGYSYAGLQIVMDVAPSEFIRAII